ncbi:hypothetical protein AADL94_05530 [Escherichia coli]
MDLYLVVAHLKNIEGVNFIHSEKIMAKGLHKVINLFIDKLNDKYNNIAEIKAINITFLDADER